MGTCAMPATRSSSGVIRVCSDAGSQSAYGRNVENGDSIRPKGYRAVERLIRKAVWNRIVPGCNERYFVHAMRKHAGMIAGIGICS